MNKNVAVYFDEPKIDDYPLNKDEYLVAYLELSRLVEERGASFYVVRGFNTYAGKGNFTKAWKFNKNGQLKLVQGGVRVDTLYDKGDRDTFKADDIEVINPRFVNEICANKDKTYEMFTILSPQSYIAKSREEVIKYMDKISTGMVVIKPKDGFEGRGVQIIKKTKNVQIDEEFYPVMVQAFIDSSGGIEGIIDGTHDFRMVVMSGDIVMCLVRTPPEGSLLANISLGGKIKFVPFDKIPHAAIAIAKEVDKAFESHGNRIYSVDLAFEKSKPYLIELNSRPGLYQQSRGEQTINFHHKLADILAKSIGASSASAK